MDQASTGVRWVYSIQCRWDINYTRQLCDSTSSEFKQAKSWLLILHNFEFNGQKAETVPSYQTIITLIRQLMNSHIVWKLSPSLSCLCWYYFHFHSYLFLKIGCRQCKVVRVLNKQRKPCFLCWKKRVGGDAVFYWNQAQGSRTMAAPLIGSWSLTILSGRKLTCVQTTRKQCSVIFGVN